jgi:hypothetical protein
MGSSRASLPSCFACVILRVATDLVASFGGLAGDGAFGVGLAQRPTNFRNGCLGLSFNDSLVRRPVLPIIWVGVNHGFDHLGA